MENLSREERLGAELEGLRSLKRQSSIFDFDSSGEPPETYTFTFSGQGIAAVNSENDEPEMADSHQVQVQMAYLYPKREPDLKWLTPIYHPNLSNSGFVDLKDIGLEWNAELSLEIICERLWDVIRLAHVDLSAATYLEARDWFQNKLTLKLPIDARPIRDRAVASQSNIVQYSRRNKKTRNIKPAVEDNRDVLFIGEEPPNLIGEENYIGEENTEQNPAARQSPDRLPSRPAGAKPNRSTPNPSAPSPPRPNQPRPSRPSPGPQDDDIMFID